MGYHFEQLKIYNKGSLNYQIYFIKASLLPDKTLPIYLRVQHTGFLTHQSDKQHINLKVCMVEEVHCMVVEVVEPN